MTKRVISKKLTEIHTYEIFDGKKVDGQSEALPLEEYIQHLQSIYDKAIKDGYTAVFCVCHTDYEYEYISVHGKRFETDEEYEIRLDKERTTAEKKERKRLADIAELEAKLKKLKGQ